MKKKHRGQSSLSSKSRLSDLIHTPKEGVTGGDNAYSYNLPISIHTPRKGCDGKAGEMFPAARISIHTPTKV